MPDKVLVVAYMSEEYAPRTFRRWEKLTKNDVSPSLASAIERSCRMSALRDASRYHSRTTTGPLVPPGPVTGYSE